MVASPISTVKSTMKGSCKGYKRGVHVDVVGEVNKRVEFGQLRGFTRRYIKLSSSNHSSQT